QVADVMRRAIANQMRANPVPLETIKAYKEVIQVIGATVTDPGRLGLTTSLPGENFSSFPFLSTTPQINLNNPPPFYDEVRGQDNDHEGFYFDDIIIGFAERGEIATSAPTEAQLGGTPLVITPTLPYGGTDITEGSYQLEIRRGTEYTIGSNPMGTQYRAGLLDTNDRLTEGVTIKIPDGEHLFDGQKFQLSDGIKTLVFEFEDRELIVGDDRFGIDPGSNFAVEFRSFESAHVIASRLRNLLNSTAVRNLLDITAALADGTATGENNGGLSSEINVFGNIVSSVSGTLNPRNLSLDRNETFAGAQSLEDVGFNLIFNADIGDNGQNNTSKFIPHTTIEAIGDGFLDHYSFFANEGDRLIIDIDNANFDSEVILFDEYGNLVDLNHNKNSSDLGSNGIDSFIEVDIPRTGNYVIRVAQFSGNSGVVPEVETNNSLGSTQNLENEDFSLLVNGSINDGGNSTLTTSTGVGAIPISETFGHVTVQGQGDGTFDYYSFYVEAGMMGIFDIDGALNINTGLNINTELFLYDPRTGDLLASNDDWDNTFPFTTDNGSTNSQDPFIQYTFAEAGTYVIGVARFDSTGNPGSIAGFPLINGDRYNLNIAIEGHDADTRPITTGQFYTMHVSIENKEIGGGRTDYFNVEGELEFEFFGDLNNEFVNLGDSNVERLQGSIQISQNKITDSATSGIVVQAPNRLSSGQSPGESVRALPTLNDDRLVRGVKISNNVIAGFGSTGAGIDLQGDGSGGNLPLAAVPFHRVINNTIYGGAAPTGT
ncbi:MAG: PPC domain-containing protein, partial [Planctomycetaceae bacterium]|nr:PPC domain-containing protein [Planctomycetaceae bacterium]